MAEGDGGPSERTSNSDEDRPSTPPPSGRSWRRPAVIAVAIAAVAALVAGIALSRTGDAGEPRTSDATAGRHATTTSLDRSASEATGGATTTGDRSATSEATDRDAGGEGGPTTTIAPGPTSTTLPGVIDPLDPHAVTQAVVDLGTAGVVPAEAAAYLEGGDERIATEFFMFTAEGVAASEVGDCRTTNTGARDSSLCTVAIETLYGARALADFALSRADDGAPWRVTQIRMVPG